MRFRILIIGFSLCFLGCRTNTVPTLPSKTSIAETKTIVTFQPTFGDKQLILNQQYSFNQNDSIEVNLLRFYISNIAFYNNNQLIHKVLNSYHLIDLAEKETLELGFENIGHQDFNTIKFNLGIDSTTNVSGVFGGDLDPTKGMYWTWQSGYINFKIEGKSNLCPSRNHRFIYHLGGYSAPFNTLQTIILPINNSIKSVVKMDIQQFFQKTDLVNDYSIMSIDEDAMELAKAAKKCFKTID